MLENRRRDWRWLAARWLGLVIGAVGGFAGGILHASDLISDGALFAASETWLVNPALSGWNPYGSGGLRVTRPETGFTGRLLSQAVNGSNVGGKTLTLTFEAKLLAEAPGVTAVVAFDYFDQTLHGGPVRVAALANRSLTVGSWVNVVRTIAVPESVLTLQRIAFEVRDEGEVLVRNVKLEGNGISVAAAPQITTASPITVPTYAWFTDVVIDGSGFGNTQPRVLVGRQQVTVATWSNTKLTLQLDHYAAGGAVVVENAQTGAQNQVAKLMNVLRPTFGLDVLPIKDVVFAGQNAEFRVKVWTTNGFTPAAPGIGLIYDTNDAVPRCTYAQDTFTGAGETTLTVNTAGLAPGTYRWVAQTIEQHSYARFAPFPFTVIKKRASGRGDNMPAFIDESRVPSAMGLPCWRVNMSVLEPILEGTLFWMTTPGPTVAFRLYYMNDPGGTPGAFGLGWRHSYQSTVEIDGSAVRVIGGGGSETEYISWRPIAGIAAGETVVLPSPEANFDRLTCYGTYFTHYHKNSRLTYRYDYSAGATTAYLTRITDPNGHFVALDLDPGTHALRTITDETGRVVRLEYDGSGRCVRLRVPGPSAERTAAFVYGGNRLLSITDLAGNQASYEYNSEDRITKNTTGAQSVTFHYAARPNNPADLYLNQIDTPDAGSISYGFAVNNPQIVLRTDATGAITEFNTEGGRPSVSVDPLGQVTQVEYLDGLPVASIDSKGASKRYTYDGSGNVTRILNEQGVATDMTYNDAGLITRIQNSAGDQWNYEYDSRGNLSRVFYPTGGNATVLRHAVAGQPLYGRVWRATDPLGNETEVNYDRFGNVTDLTDSLGRHTMFVWDTAGLRCDKIIDAKGNEKRLSYDLNDRLLSVAYVSSGGTPLGSVNYAWDHLGQTELTDEVGTRVTAVRDTEGRLVEMSGPLGAVTRRTYDGLGRVIEERNPLGNRTAFAYDAAGHLTSRTDPLNRIERLAYDETSNLTEYRDPSDKSMEYRYDSAGRILEIRLPGGQVANFFYNSLGQLAQQQNARDELVKWTHDALGNVTETFHGSAKVADMTYDLRGRLVGLTDGTGVTAFSYSKRSEVARITWPDGLQASFDYDEVGNVASITYPDGTVVQYAYDNFNRISLPERWRNASSAELTGDRERAHRATRVAWDTCYADYELNARANVVREVRSNGTSTSYVLDALGRPTSIQHGLGATTFASQTVAYDAAGNIISETTTGLPTAVMPAPASATITGPNQLTNWRNQARGYDADGNLAAVGTGVWSGNHDPENRLVRFTRAGQAEVLLAYNGLGRLWSRTQGSQVERFHYSPAGQLLCITNAAGALIANCIHANGVLVAVGSRAAGYNFFHYNHLGNTVAVTDAAGAVVATYAYDAWGFPQPSVPTFANRFTFLGSTCALDWGDGLFLLGKRHYDAGAGRFLEQDPIGLRGGGNLYAYGRNSPLNFMDPGGMAEIPSAGWAGAGRALNCLSLFKLGKKIGTSIDKTRQFSQKVEEVNQALDRVEEKRKRVEAAWDDLEKAKKAPKRDEGEIVKLRGEWQAAMWAENDADDDLSHQKSQAYRAAAEANDAGIRTNIEFGGFLLTLGGPVGTGAQFVGQVVEDVVVDALGDLLGNAVTSTPEE